MKHRVLLIQLPVPSPSRYLPSGFSPLASAVLGDYLHTRGIDVFIAPLNLCETGSDSQITEYILNSGATVCAFSLYLWNSERSRYIASQVRKADPGILLFAGGPEVTHDNLWLTGDPETPFDLFFQGESEELFAEVLSKPFRAVDFPAKLSAPGAPLQDLTVLSHGYGYSPWLIKPDPQKTFYLETARGCASSCSYCFYPRFENRLRTLSIQEVIRRIQDLTVLGAAEIAFLDSTFSRRPGFSELLDHLADFHKLHKINFFAELRGEDIDASEAKRLKAAGFSRIEIGIQSFNTKTLIRNGRPSDPKKALEGAAFLHEEGIELLIDIMAGLPGDSPEDVFRAIDEAEALGLEDYFQIFPVSVLPGTALRRNAAEWGIRYQNLPPYHITETPEFAGIADTLLQCEDLLGRPLEDFARIGFTEAADITEEQPGFHKSCIINAGQGIDSGLILNRIRTDPHSVVDLIIRADSPFPLNYADTVSDILLSDPGYYLARSVIYEGINLQRRACILVPLNLFRNHPDWCEEAANCLPLYLEASAAEIIRSLKTEKEIPETFRFLITDEPSSDEFFLLAGLWTPDYISFKLKSAEEYWTLHHAGFTEVKYSLQE